MDRLSALNCTTGRLATTTTFVGSPASPTLVVSHWDSEHHTDCACVSHSHPSHLLGITSSTTLSSIQPTSTYVPLLVTCLLCVSVSTYCGRSYIYGRRRRPSPEPRRRSIVRNLRDRATYWCSISLLTPTSRWKALDSVNAEHFVGFILGSFWREYALLLILGVAEILLTSATVYCLVYPSQSSYQTHPALAVTESNVFRLFLAQLVLVPIAHCSRIINTRLAEATSIALTGGFIRARLSPDTTWTNGTKDRGRLANLISSDIDVVCGSRTAMVDLGLSLVQTLIYSGLLYTVLGNSMFVGLLMAVVVDGSFNYFCSAKEDRLDSIFRVQTEQRLTAVQQLIEIVTCVSLYKWRQRYCHKVNLARTGELDESFRREQINSIRAIFSNVFLPMTVVLCLAGYFAVVQGTVFTGAIIVQAILYAENIKVHMSRLGSSATLVHRANQAFTRLRDSSVQLYTEDRTVDNDCQRPLSGHVDHLSSLWKRFKNFPNSNGRTHVVHGPKGSGKSRLLRSLTLRIFESLSEENPGGVSLVAYVPQKPCILDVSIKDNIVFGSSWDSRRYRDVLQACQLLRDLEQRSEGDLYVCGYAGSRLSAGQQTRIALARALYSKAPVLIVDECLASLDIHTRAAVIDSCFNGPLVQKRWAVLASPTGNLHISGASYVSLLNAASSIEPEDVYLRRDSPKTCHLSELSETVSSEGNHGTLSVRMETMDLDSSMDRATSLRAVRSYWNSMWDWKTGCFVTSAIIILEIMNVVQVSQLSLWADRPFVKAQMTWTGLLHVIGFCAAAAFLLSYIARAFVAGGLRASHSFHVLLVEASGKMAYFGRTRDLLRVGFFSSMQVVDRQLRGQVYDTLTVGIALLVKLCFTAFLDGCLLFPALCLCFILIHQIRRYLPNRTRVEQESVIAKTRLLSVIEEAASGSLFLNSLGCGTFFMQRALDAMNESCRVRVCGLNLDNSFHAAVDGIMGLYVTVVACGTVFVAEGSGSSSTLIVAYGLSQLITTFVKLANQLLLDANSVSVIEQAVSMPRDPHEKATTCAEPDNFDLKVSCLDVWYSGSGRILRGVSFDVRASAKVAVVGRTGSGKTTLALSLAQFIQSSGNVRIGELEIYRFSRHQLMSIIAFVPQSPLILSGTLKENLSPDPIVDLSEVIENTGLRALGYTEDTVLEPEKISERVKQLIAIGRAMASGAKIVILDEAAECVHKNERIWSYFKDKTLISICHNLDYIETYDQVMVLDSGRIVEYDTPATLMGKEGGELRGMVDAWRAGKEGAEEVA